MKKEELTQLQFIYTKDDFLIDDTVKTDNEFVIDWQKKFKEEKFKALYELGFINNYSLSLSTFFLHQISETFFKELVQHAEIEILREKIKFNLNDEIIHKLLNSIPYVVGSENITEEWLNHIFDELLNIFKSEIKEYQGTVQLYFAEKSQDLKIAHRIYFHLVDYPDKVYPFAFMATYATKEKNRIHHVPLKHALLEYKNDRTKLLSLLSCLNAVAEVSPLISSFMEKGEMFHPIKLTAKEAYLLLLNIPEIEKCNIKCRVPNWWRKKNSSINLNVKIGEKKPSLLGLESLLEMNAQLAVNGLLLSEEEIEKLLQEEEGLVWLKGQWVEVNHHRLEELLSQMKQFDGSMTLKEAISMHMNNEKIDPDNHLIISNGKWLGKVMDNLRNPNKLKTYSSPKYLQAELRPYQKIGYNWLTYMKEMGLGACLADDMGLGKTIQVLAFLENIFQENKNSKVLLIVPASLLGNWEKEINHFAPNISFQLLHGKTHDELQGMILNNQKFLTITTYTMATKLNELENVQWNCLILDEAQAIKNPLTKQTRAIKKIPAEMKIAMTGTPIENDLSNLWSLFDFLNKGLLGSSKEFKQFGKMIEIEPQNTYKLKNMIAPFILRRLKTDKTIINDLPDKIEVNDFVSLTKKQQALYQKVTNEMIAKLENSTGMERRGLVLATLTKLKQICNHPDQFLHQSDYLPKESGKYELLKELCETIYEKRERVLVFTQYREICDYLSDYLEKIFHKKGYIIHGNVPVKKRQEIVEKFNGDEYIPYIICSVKAAGTGLNLTAANHVIHFDRWWNPAVENQASDRAYRIGQTKKVFVHKLVTKGSVEEKIDELINSKKSLADEIISKGENWITEMSNEQLISILTLGGTHE